MKHNLYLPLALLFTALICMGTQCNKIEIEYKYNFLEKVNLYPVQKSYHLGDTIWLQYTNPTKKLFDSRTNQYISAEDVNISFQIGYNSRYNAPVNPTHGFCDFISSNGVNSGRYLGTYGNSISYVFGCNTNNSYDFTVGVVPTQKGIYSLDLTGVNGTVTGCADNTLTFPLSTIEYSFNVNDCNKEIYLSIPPASRGESGPGYTEKNIDNKKSYILTVD